MFIVYTEISDRDALVYEGILSKKDQNECKTKDDVKDHIDFVSYFADDGVRVKVDHITEDGNMTTVYEKVVKSKGK